MPSLLIVASYFYPFPGVGAVRLSEWARLLPEHGWSVTVACRNHGHTASSDEIARRLHPGVHVRPLDDAFVTRPKTLAVRLQRRLLRTVAVPADLEWWYWRSKRRQLAEMARAVRADVVLTSSPPHSIHIAGMHLAADTGIPWAADFRDPYTTDRRNLPAGWPARLALLHRRFERNVYRKASVILDAIPPHARWAMREYSFAQDRIVCLPNGTPPELLDDRVVPIRSDTDRVSLRVVGHAGPEQLAQIVRAISLLTDPSRVELRVVGPVPVDAKQLEQVLGDRLITTGPKPHPAALQEIAGADVLLAPLSTKRSRWKGASSKMFEYLGAGKPIILINPTEADRELFQAAPGVQLLAEPNDDDLHRALERAMSVAPDVLRCQRAFVRNTYRRDDQVARLSTVLAGLVRPPSSARRA